MAAGPRILHLADSHIGAELPARPRLPGRRRGDDFVDNYRRVLRHALDQQVDLVIHAGDVFDRSRPGDAALAAAGGPLLEVAAAGIPVVVIGGNHERSRIPPSLLLTHANIHVVHAPTTLTFTAGGARIAIAALPCIRRGSAAAFAPALEQTGWRDVSADVRILVAHQAFESATCGPGNYRFRSHDDVVERDAVPDAFDYVALGHVHRHQALPGGSGGAVPLVYCGSPDRISFAEKDEPKGCCLVDFADGGTRWRFLEHPVRPMLIKPIDVTGLGARQIRTQVLDAVASLPAEAVAQVRLSGRAPRGLLDGLRLSARAREARGDALVTVLSQAVEFDGRTGGTARSPAPVSAFTRLDAPAVETERRSVDELRALPDRRGVYALYDDARRLLYIGKATHARTRVRSHLRSAGSGHYFDGWSEQIRHVEVCPVYSDLEALLVEADLVRKWRPPFNRQMRMWRRYCYLVGSVGALEIRPQPDDRLPSYGPFASRGSARHLIEALDAVPALVRESRWPARVLAKRLEGLLRGSDDAWLCEIEQHLAGDDAFQAASPAVGETDQTVAAGDGCEAASAAGGEPGRTGAAARSGGPQAANSVDRRRLRTVETLRWAFERARLLRAAEGLVGASLVLPGPDAAARVAVLGAHGVRFRAAADADFRESPRVLRPPKDQAGGGTDSSVTPSGRRLPKWAVDTLCVAARALRRESRTARGSRRASGDGERDRTQTLPVG